MTLIVPCKNQMAAGPYFASDVAYHLDKLQRTGEPHQYLGADHGGYVKRMTAATQALSGQADAGCETVSIGYFVR